MTTSNTRILAIVSNLIIFRRTAKVELEIKLPAPLVTSLTFDGPNLDVLYVTTANLNLADTISEDAGYLFKITGLGAHGLEGVKVRV